MKAAQINQYGHADEITLTEVETPDVSDSTVLIAVHASSINPVDTMVREGVMKVAQLPTTLGGDVAGVIVKLGANVTSLAVDDKVYGQASVLAGNSGAFAEFAITSPDQLAKMPTTATFEQSASLPLVGVSALQALTDHIGLQPGQRLFIHGGAGGIGSIAIQIAKHIGAYVATTATGDGIAFVQQLGADEVIDYKAAQFGDVLTDFDAVFDTVGGDDFTTALHVLKPGGVAVSMTATADEALVKELDIIAVTQFTKVSTNQLTRLAALVDQGIVTPQIDAVFPLADVRQAFEARESGKVKGKVVLTITP